MDVKFTSHKEEFLSELEKAKQRALVRIGMRAEANAKAYTPVQTGRLAGSITYATATSSSSPEAPAKAKDSAQHGTPDDDSVYIGTNVEYAPYVELGSSKRKNPARFLTRAMTLHGDEYVRILKSELSGGGGGAVQS